MRARIPHRAAVGHDVRAALVASGMAPTTGVLAELDKVIFFFSPGARILALIP
jgi:hypothetical protein